MSTAIPLDLLKSEQAQINKELAVVEHQLRVRDGQYELTAVNLKKAFDLVEDCALTYRLADEYIKRILNQALCDKIWVEPDGNVEMELAEPFKSMIEPIGIAYCAIQCSGREMCS